ncbi:hypothetical protein ARTHRO9V_280281 [Arthrobacter sp. 9V]|nr:hypothetical protein ARTHRO9V_280281 [Arthrobacter sp. 9V]
MSFSTAVDNFVPYRRVNVDKTTFSPGPVDNPVNQAVEFRVSTDLSTVLITYIAVVHGMEGVQILSKPGILKAKPTTFSPAVDNLWVGGCC